MASRNIGSEQTVRLNVPGMVCDGCAERIRYSLRSLTGVQKVKTSLWRKQVSVGYKPEQIDQEAIIEALTRLGYDADPSS